MSEIRSSYALPIALCLLFIFVAGIFLITLYLRNDTKPQEDYQEPEQKQDEAEHNSLNKKE